MQEQWVNVFSCIALLGGRQSPLEQHIFFDVKFKEMLNNSGSTLEGITEPSSSAVRNLSCLFAQFLI